jgi:purine-binding chemotaxis protein CheW
MMNDNNNTTRSDDLELISFVVGGQDFCVDVRAVREVRCWTQATPLPHSPDYIFGVINLRGTVLPVIDLALRLGLKSTEPSARSVIIVVHIGRRVVGLLVEAVSDIIVSSSKAVQPTPDVACDAVKQFINGILTVEDRMISMIVLDQVLPSQQEEAA